VKIDAINTDAGVGVWCVTLLNLSETDFHNAACTFSRYK